jgi:hypothetical protein
MSLSSRLLHTPAVERTGLLSSRGLLEQRKPTQLWG